MKRRSPVALLWSSHPPASALRKQLEREGAVLLVADERGEHPGALRVVASGRADRAPEHVPSDRPWVWACPGKPSSRALAAAATAAVYDIVDLTRPPAEVAARLIARVRELEVTVSPPRHADQIVTRSAAAQRLVRELAHAARTSMPVLLTGETGTGKEVLTRLLHAWSARRDKPFVPVHCAAIPDEMLEAELFGYTRGAFSGAVRSYDGQLRAAEGGSVFLDEVDDTPLSFQVKLLRVLEDRVVSRLGENVWHKVDFRILAATNRELEGLIADGLFGPDLYERLAIVSIHVPPLRERREDIPELCERLIARFYDEEPDARSRHTVKRVTDEALELLVSHHWPGNIRELRNVLYAALVRKRAGTELLVSDVPLRLLRARSPGLVLPGDRLFERARLEARIENGHFNLRESIEQLERDALTLALEQARGNAASAATLLGEVGRGAARDPGATVRAMMRRLGIRMGAQRRRQRTRTHH